MTLCSSMIYGCPRTGLRVYILVVSLVLGLILAMAVRPSLTYTPDPAGPPQRSAEAERLTTTFMSLNAQDQAASTTEQARLLSNLRRVAVACQQLLAELVEQNPGEVLRVAIPAHLRANLPVTLEPYLEEDVALTGILEVLHEDRDRGSRYLYFLDVAGKRFSLHFAAEPPSLLSGSRVRVLGLRIKNALALASGKTSAQALMTIAPNTFGAQSTLVIPVNFQDKATQPYTIDSARNVVFTTTSNFDLENS